MNGDQDDFYVDDEPVGDVLAAWNDGEKGRTGRDEDLLLSAQERALLANLSEGMSIDQIAAMLAVDEDTVRRFLTGVFHKLGAA